MSFIGSDHRMKGFDSWALRSIFVFFYYWSDQMDCVSLLEWVRVPQEVSNHSPVQAGVILTSWIH